MRHLVRSERSVNGSLGSPNSSARRSGMRPLPFRAAFAATRRQEMLLSSKTCSVKHQHQVSGAVLLLPGPPPWTGGTLRMCE